MFLAFRLRDLITVPFGWLMGQLYQLTGNYGVAMILFAVCVQMVMLPITAKSKKSSAATPTTSRSRPRPSGSCSRMRAFPWAAAACGA